MHRLDLPAGSTIRFTATARADVAPHQWGIEVFAIEASAPHLTYGSAIGGHDRDQRIDIPAQPGDCRLEVKSRHAVVGGWADDACTINEDTPGQLILGFSDASLPGVHRDDVVLNFVFKAPARAA